ncbi:hypothetical protein M3Y99_01910000 [Aphelenchoides fujianensis]|nr:hypothetical protein M3Y99_01910000 [Aphelenchoides fujianensis]
MQIRPLLAAIAADSTTSEAECSSLVEADDPDDTNPASDVRIKRRPKKKKRKMGKKKAVEKKGEEAELDPASLLQMMRYATKFDWFLLVAGVLLSVVAGVLSPLSSIVFKGITNTLMQGQAEYAEDRLDLEWFTS